MKDIIVSKNVPFTPWRYRYENEYEELILSHCNRIFPDYWSCKFNKPIYYSKHGRKKADIALVCKDYRSWIVIEVEFSHHSFNSHVLPQVETFLDGEYNGGHAEYLVQAIPELDFELTRRLVEYNPPQVLVIVDKQIELMLRWSEKFNELGVKFSQAIPYISNEGEILLRYRGWLPEPRNIASTEAKWEQGMLFLASPSAVINTDVDEIIVNFENLSTKWNLVQMRDTITLVPLDRRLISMLAKTSYKLVAEDGRAGSLTLMRNR